MGDDVISVTNAMIEAGSQTHWVLTGSWPSRVTLEAIYVAMRESEALDRLSPNLEGEK